MIDQHRVSFRPSGD